MMLESRRNATTELTEELTFHRATQVLTAPERPRIPYGSATAPSKQYKP